MALKYCVFDDTTGRLTYASSPSRTVTVSADPTITPVDAVAGTLIVWSNSATSKFYWKRDTGSTTNVAPADMSALSSLANGGWGWVNRGTPSFSVISGTTARLTLATDAIIMIGGRQVHIPYGNYDVVPSGGVGQRYAYFDDASQVLKLSTSPWNLKTSVPAFTCHWDGSSIDGIGYEMHGMRDLVWHSYQHKYVGAQYDSGIEATGAVQADNNTDPPTTAEFLWFTTGQITDEDNAILVGTSYWNQTLGSGLTNSTAAIITFWYYNGTNIVKQSAMADRAAFIHAGGNTTPMWNNGGVLTEATSGQYVVYHYYASVLVGGDCLWGRPHNAVFTTLASAQAATPDSLTWTGFSVDDAKYCYRAVFKVDTARYTTPTHRSKLVALGSFRLTAGTPVATTAATSHQALSNRDSPDCHPTTAITNFADDALAASVQAGAITSGVTKAPTHDAVYAALNSIYTQGSAQVIADGGVTEVVLTSLGLTLTSTCLLEVMRNGQDLFEGAALDFTRDVANNKVVFNYTVPKNTKFKFRVYRG